MFRCLIVLTALVFVGSTRYEKNHALKRELAEKIFALTSQRQEDKIFDVWKNMAIPINQELSDEANARVRNIFQPALDQVSMKTKEAVIKIWIREMNMDELTQMHEWYSTPTAQKIQSFDIEIQKESAKALQDVELQESLKIGFDELNRMKDEL